MIRAALCALALLLLPGCIAADFDPTTGRPLRVRGLGQVKLAYAERAAPVVASRECDLPPGVPAPAPGGPLPPGTVCTYVVPERVAAVEAEPAGRELTVEGGPLSAAFAGILGTALGAALKAIPAAFGLGL